MIEMVQPKMGAIALYVDLGRETARAVAAATAHVAREAGYSVALLEDQERVLNLGTRGANVEDAVLFVTIGGDGTLLRAAQIAAPHGIPLLGINTGRLGFLTEMDGSPQALAKLPAMLRDGFAVEERLALQARVHDTVHFALNDIVVRRTENAHMVPFGLFIDGREAARVPADGIVVATPTGSTAYFLSAGGPILAPNVDAIGISALLPHTLFSRPLVVPSFASIMLSCDETQTGVALEADGRTVDRLHPGERVTVERYPHYVKFARREPLDFFTLLEDKLRWNAPIKDQK